MFKKSPNCQSRGNRPSDHTSPAVNSVSRDGRRVFAGRRACAARALCRRGRLHRTSAQRRQLFKRPRDYQRSRSDRRGCDTSRVRLPVRKRVSCRGVGPACGIRFIGPHADVVRLLGDKARARDAMRKAGLPLLPGSDGPFEGTRRARGRGRRQNRVPVDREGGCGGRRPRDAHRSDVLRTFRTRCGRRSARRTKHSATGPSTSRNIWRTRRDIEFQILADEHGNVVHLGERECSIQRRRQKLLEE